MCTDLVVDEKINKVNLRKNLIENVKKRTISSLFMFSP